MINDRNGGEHLGVLNGFEYVCKCVLYFVHLFALSNVAKEFAQQFSDDKF